MKRIFNLFRKTNRYRILFKNGQSIYITAENFKINYNTSTGTVTKYEIDGIRDKTRILYMNPAEIDAITFV